MELNYYNESLRKEILLRNCSCCTSCKTKRNCTFQVYTSMIGSWSNKDYTSVEDMREYTKIYSNVYYDCKNCEVKRNENLLFNQKFMSKEFFSTNLSFIKYFMKYLYKNKLLDPSVKLQFHLDCNTCSLDPRDIKNIVTELKQYLEQQNLCARDDTEWIYAFNSHVDLFGIKLKDTGDAQNVFRNLQIQVKDLAPQALTEFLNLKDYHTEHKFFHE